MRMAMKTSAWQLDMKYEIIQEYTGTTKFVS